MIGGKLAALRRCLRIDHARRSRFGKGDSFECFYLLCDAVFEYLHFVLTQIPDGLAVTRRVQVDANGLNTGAEGWLLRIGGRALLRRRGGHQYEPQGDQSFRSRAHAET